MGGVSDGFALEGFDVTGIDIVDAPKLLGYKHRFIQADMLTLKGEDFRGYDVVWGSPPCRDFSNLAHCGSGSIRKNGSFLAWKDPPNIRRGLETVLSFLKFVEKAEAKFWIMENVSNLALYLKEIHPKALNCKIWGGKRHVFYGIFPSFLIPITERHISHMETKGRIKSWIRAKIPLACSRAFARACQEALEVKGVVMR
jgi:site-specific DNA-cytosine methylase